MMKKILLFAGLLLAVSACRNGHKPNLVNQHVDFACVHVSDSFWSPRLERVARVTIPVCIDQTEVQTGRIRNFENAAKAKANIQVSSLTIRMSIRLLKLSLTV